MMLHVESPRPLKALYTPGTVLLESTRRDGKGGRNLLFADPVYILTARRPEEVDAVLAGIDEAARAGRYAAGFLAYEAGATLLPVGESTGDGLLAWFGVYEAPLAVSAGEADGFFEGIADAARLVTEPTFSYSREEYRRKMAVARRHIAEGDIYQVNLTGAFSFRFEGPPLGLYAHLRQRQRVPFAAFIDTGETQVASLSPELFFRREGERIRAEPMKGTVRRGRTLEEDERLAAWLRADEKSRAENLMIVDLLRNDLSVVCRPGTVRVPELFETTRYETLTQMTSTVEGVLRPGVGHADVLRALFPCGSVTGAPKIRAMQIIQALEPEPRGVYCGAVGFAGPRGEAVFSVAIRTLVLNGGEGRMGVGSGIVADSDADAEYDECLLKGRFLTDAGGDDAPCFELIETMRAEAGEIPLLGLHLDRLEDSARYFLVLFDRDDVQRRIEQVLTADKAGPCKVRLTLGRDGAAQITVSEAAAPEGGRVKLASRRVDSADTFLYHKTTRRAFYEAEFRKAAEEGYVEAIFLNERGEVAEGSRTNVFVRIGEALLTPPLESGLLPGVYRRHVLETVPTAREAVLFPEDLREASAIFVCNAVWGMVEVKPGPASGFE